MSIWLTGSRGMLGKQIAQQLQQHHSACFQTDAETDITDLAVLRRFASGKKITWMINCAAYTAVDRAEAEMEQALAVNCAGAQNLAILAAECHARLIHFSSDFVFDGQKNGPYIENDVVNPLGVYGLSKARSEIAVRDCMDRFFIFRISWLYGVGGANFVKTMVRLLREKGEVSVVADQIGSPTYCGVLAQNIARLVHSDSQTYGVYHYCDQGAISWYDFACQIRLEAIEMGWVSSQSMVHAIASAAFPTAAKRPAFSVLDTQYVQNVLKFQVQPWELNLHTYFQEWREVNGGTHS